MTSITIESRVENIRLAPVPDWAEPTSYRDALNEPGSWTLTVPNTPEYLALLRGDNLIAFRDFDEYTFWGLPEARNVVVAADQRTITATGRGIAGVFGWGTIYPARGVRRWSQDERFFGWGAGDFFSTGLGVAFAPPEKTVAPIPIDGWPVPETSVMWPVLGGARPAGERAWFYRPYTSTIARRYRVDAAGDNAVSVWVDDQQIIDESVLSNDPSGIVKARTWRGTMPAGTHWFSVRGENIPADMSADSGITIGPAWVAIRVAEVDDTDEDAGTHLFSAWSDGWQATLDEPGWPAGLAAILMISEAVARGTSIAPITIGFTNTVDSYGQPWEFNVNRSWSVGTDLLSFLQELTDSGVDFWIDATDRKLHAAPKRGTDRSADVILFPGKHLPQVAITGTQQVRNVAVVSTKVGMLEVTIPASIALYGRRETLINLSSEDSLVRARATAKGMLEPLAWPSLATEAEKTQLLATEPGPDGIGGTRPFKDFTIGDVIGFPGEDGQATTARVLGITRELGKEPKWYVEVDLAQAGARTVKPSAAQRTLRIAKSGGAASIGGLINSATK